MFPCRDRFVLHSSFRGNVGRGASETSPCRRTGNAKRRARPPRGDGEQPGRRRGNRDPRAFFGMAWLLAAPASVSLHSVVGPQQSLPRWFQAMWLPSRTDSFGFDVRFFGHRPGGQSNRGWGRTCAAARQRGPGVQFNAGIELVWLVVVWHGWLLVW